MFVGRWISHLPPEHDLFVPFIYWHLIRRRIKANGIGLASHENQIDRFSIGTSKLNRGDPEYEHRHQL